MTLEQRITKLEKAEKAGSMVHVWAEAGETAEQAIVRQFPAGVTKGVSVTVFRWATS